jgi:DNA (cytosine-5)-methyltransferase 1
LKPRLLDLYCCAGGAAKGYQRAGFHVVGVDKRPQPRYCGDKFVQGDALRFLGGGGAVGFDAIHASPPCQAYCALTRASGTQDRHPDLIAPTREVLEASGLPYVIENVVEARPIMRDPVLFCGAAMGLDVVRHRLFEANWPLMSPGCAHEPGGTTTGRYVAFRPSKVAPGRKVPPRRGRAAWREAVGIDWMTEPEVAQAIPPAYTEYIGHQLMQVVKTLEAAA